MIQSKVSTLENVVDRMSEDITNNGRTYSDSAPKFLKKNSTIPSPRLSTCTPRSSVDRKSPLQTMRKSDSWEEGSWMDPRVVKTSRNPVKKGMHGVRNGIGDSGSGRNGISDSGFGSSVRNGNGNGPFEIVKGYLIQGDLDSAYVEALNCGDELVLVDLLDKTGPVLESLSNRTANDVLGTLAFFLSEQQFMSSIIPWLQQVIFLC